MCLPCCLIPAGSRRVSFMDGPTEPGSLQPPGKANFLVQDSAVSTNAAFSKGNFSYCAEREERVKMDEQG